MVVATEPIDQVIAERFGTLERIQERGAAALLLGGTDAAKFACFYRE